MSNGISIRDTFSVSTSTDFTTKKGLTASTGREPYQFEDVILKELLDNSIDACESAGIAPQITIGYEHDGTFATYCVADNGGGLSKETIEKILDFDTRTSDKAAMKSPTRGAQGNAFKTILGIPSTCDGYVIIESLGFSHRIKINATESMILPTDYDITEIPLAAGTSVKVIMKRIRSNAGLYWAQQFAVFNPHIRVKIGYIENLKNTMLTFDTEIEESAVFYPNQTNFKKITPNEPTNAHNYTSDEFYSLACLTGSQTRKTTYAFASSFKGTSAKAKAQKITSTINGKFVSDIYTDRETIDALHDAIKLESKPTRHDELGLIGKDGLLANLKNVGQSWYAKTTGDINGFPFVFEVLTAESYNNNDTYFFGINHSPTYTDFLKGDILVTQKIGGYGIEGLLHKVIDTENHAVVCHLVCPNLTFKDKGKSGVSIPSDVKNAISETIEKTVKAIQRENKSNLTAYQKEQKAIKREQNGDKVTQTFAVKNVLDEAIKKATNDGNALANVRNLYYNVRDMIQRFNVKSELNYTYFSQDLLIKYWRLNGRNKNIYNDARGTLHHPHDGFELAMGTLKVDSYIFPQHHYNKILYIEKKGLCLPIQAANLPEKYDMALIGGEGYACEAVRVLLDRAQAGEDYIIFVLHDADPDGYNIARTLQEETDRMPDHKITVIDLGFRLQTALDMGLQPENKRRKKALPSTVEFTDFERDFFCGEKVKGSDNKEESIGRIIELNAMDTVPFVQYVDDSISRELDARGIPYKIVPPEEILNETAIELRDEKLRKKIKSALLKKFDIEKMIDDAMDLIQFDGVAFTDDVTEYLRANQLETWRVGLSEIIDNQISANQSVLEVLK